MVAREGLFLCRWEGTTPRRRERPPSLASTEGSSVYSKRHGLDSSCCRGYCQLELEAGAISIRIVGRWRLTQNYIEGMYGRSTIGKVDLSVYPTPSFDVR